jgi:regulator of sirC expression with transglutaminase-like and TPR domain
LDATARFTELVQGPEDDLGVALDEACLLIAAHADPDLEVHAYRSRLDGLAAGCPAPTLDALRDHLFGPDGFRGNRDDYYDPRNSYLNHVIDRRTGIPITLSVVVMEVGRRLGIDLEGVGMPGHFLLRHRGDPPVMIDPFEGGALVTPADSEARFRAVHGEEATFDPTFLEPVGPRAIVARILANLKQLHAARGDGRSLEWVLRLRMALPDAGHRDRLELAEVQSARGRFAEAASTLDSVPAHPGDEAADLLRARATQMRARLN